MLLASPGKTSAHVFCDFIYIKVNEMNPSATIIQFCPRHCPTFIEDPVPSAVRREQSFEIKCSCLVLDQMNADSLTQEMSRHPGLWIRGQTLALPLQLVQRSTGNSEQKTKAVWLV